MVLNDIIIQQQKSFFYIYRAGGKEKDAKDQFP